MENRFKVVDGMIVDTENKIEISEGLVDTDYNQKETIEILNAISSGVKGDSKLVIMNILGEIPCLFRSVLDTTYDQGNLEEMVNCDLEEFIHTYDLDVLEVDDSKLTRANVIGAFNEYKINHKFKGSSVSFDFLWAKQYGDSMVKNVVITVG